MAPLRPPPFFQSSYLYPYVSYFSTHLFRHAFFFLVLNFFASRAPHHPSFHRSPLFFVSAELRASGARRPRPHPEPNISTRHAYNDLIFLPLAGTHSLPQKSNRAHNPNQLPPFRTSCLTAARATATAVSHLRVQPPAARESRLRRRGARISSPFRRRSPHVTCGGGARASGIGVSVSRLLRSHRQETPLEPPPREVLPVHVRAPGETSPRHQSDVPAGDTKRSRRRHNHRG